MLIFRVDDMSCGHCVRAIKDAVRELDDAAAVDVDLTRHLVRVQSGQLDAHQVQEALTRAGYSAAPTAIPEAQPTKAAGCCGSPRCGCAG